MTHQPDSTGDHTGLADRYAELWKDHQAPPDLQAFVDRCHDLSMDALSEILLVDQSFRWRYGNEITVEEYLAQWPSLTDHAELVLDLIYGEMRGLCDRGDVPDQAAFAKRFPQWKRQLAQQAASELWHPTSQKFCDSQPSAGLNPEKPCGEDHGDEPASNIDPKAPVAFSDFIIGDRLGGGAMGEVYRATQKSLGKSVAIKIFKPIVIANRDQLIDRFLREGRTVAGIRHKNIVDVHGIGRCSDGGYFLVMDLIEGESLDHRIEKAPLPYRQAVQIVAEVARAIAHANQQGIIHRDLKPSNVLLDREGQVKVTDFGLAKLLGNSEVTLCDDTALQDGAPSVPGQVIGTPQFMAPEQADPERWGPISPATDIYGLGALLYTLLTGQPPIPCKTLSEILTVLVSAKPLAPLRNLCPDIPTTIQDICMKCLSKDQRCRYDSAMEVAEALEASLEPSQEKRPSGKKPWPMPFRRTMGKRRSFLLVGVFAVGLGAWFMFVGQHHQQSALSSSTEVLWTVDAYRGGSRQDRVRLTETPGPLINGDRLQIQMEFAKKNYAYAFWINSEGQVKQLYPTDTSPFKPLRKLALPVKAEHAFPIIGKPGTEVCVVILRKTPLPDPLNPATLLQPPSPFPTLPNDTILVEGTPLTNHSGDRSQPQSAMTAPASLNDNFPDPEAWLEGERPRAIGPAEPLDAPAVLVYFRLWHETLSPELGKVYYLAVAHSP